MFAWYLLLANHQQSRGVFVTPEGMMSMFDIENVTITPIEAGIKIIATIDSCYTVELVGIDIHDALAQLCEYITKVSKPTEQELEGFKLHALHWFEHDFFPPPTAIGIAHWEQEQS